MAFQFKHLSSIFVLGLALLSVSSSSSADGKQAVSHSFATMETSLGTIKIQLFDQRTPKTVENFIFYAANGFYQGTIFHRVIDGFMIQGGGFTSQMEKKATEAPIVNEANAFIPNIRGTIAMARTSEPNSATSQFFINLVNNKNLNKTSLNPGYAVFGRVIQGMDVVDQIARTKTSNKGMMRNVPIEPIEIIKVTIEPKPSEQDSGKSTISTNG